MRTGTCPRCKGKVKISERTFKRIVAGKKNKLTHKDCGGRLFSNKYGWALTLTQETSSRDSGWDNRE